MPIDTGSESNLESHVMPLEYSVTATGTPLPQLPCPSSLNKATLLANRYEIVDIVGRGATAIVYRAHDRVLCRDVAIKVLGTDRAVDTRWIHRLAREVRVARKVVHPNVCRVFELANSDGHWFVTMELASSGSLRSVIELERTRQQRFADASAIIHGLAAIHRAGIVHRDVTPQNLLRMHDGRLVVADFGLAMDGDITLTDVAGTPRYMAPEVVRGDPPSQAADVWQLGLVLHQVLFGSWPQWQDVKGRIRLQRPKVAQCHGAMVRLCAGCLREAKSSRFESATAVETRWNLLEREPMDA